MNWDLLFQLVVNGIIVGALYGVVAMSFVLIYKASQVVNFAQGEFLVGDRDVHLGDISGAPFYISAPQFEYWKHTHLTVDVVPGRGSGGSRRL